MPKTITCTLSYESIGKAIKELNQYKESVKRKAEKLRERVAEEIQSLAQSGFAGAIADDLTELSGGARTADVSVTIESDGNVTLVIASGEDAIWAEFGSGVHHNGSAGSSPHPKGAELGMTIGGYGKGYGKRDVWAFYDGDTKRYSCGAPASMPMYRAMQEVCDRIYSIAREVFSGD